MKIKFDNDSSANGPSHPNPISSSVFKLFLGAVLLGSVIAPVSAQTFSGFSSGNVVVSRIVYQNVGEAAALIAGSSILPNSSHPVAVADGSFPNVFNNLSVDSNFGVTAPVYLDQFTPGGSLVNSLAVPTSSITGSFSSKSEGALSLSQDGTKITFAGYDAPAGAIDRSNSSTPGIHNYTNKDTATFTFREIAEVNAAGAVTTTKTNAYTGDNPRAAILGSSGLYYSVGNTASNATSSPTAASVTGVQIITPGVNATSSSPGTTSAGSYNITQNGYTADKLEKDNNFRGITIHGNTLYATKGSGSNGINSVYQVGTAGTLPTGTGNTISILSGFPTDLASGSNVMHPFGLWFANDTTLYVADEGNGTGTNAFAGLQKWTLSGGIWNLNYTLQAGLIGDTYTVAEDAFQLTTVGLRNLTGILNSDGTVTLYGITATNSSATEIGADPNRFVAITDTLSFSTSTQAAGESFNTLGTAAYGEVFRGVSLAPTAVPEPSYVGVMVGFVLATLVVTRRARRRSQIS